MFNRLKSLATRDSGLLKQTLVSTSFDALTLLGKAGNLVQGTLYVKKIHLNDYDTSCA